MKHLLLLLVLVGMASPVMAQTAAPVRIAPAQRQRVPSLPPARAFLVDMLAGVDASGPVGEPDPELAPQAQGLGLRESGARLYGDTGVYIYRTADEATAATLVRLLRPDGARFVDLGDGGYSSPQRTVFYSGPYTAVISGSGPGLDSIPAALAATIGPRQALPPLATHLPAGDRVEGSVRYAATVEALRRLRPDLGSDVYLVERGGAEAVVADYAGGGTPFRVTLVAYETPQLAADAARSLKAFTDGLSPEAKQGRLMRREGNYLIEATGVTDEGVARALVDSVDYSYEVKWLREPLPPDLTRLDAGEEAQKVAQVLVSSFAIVGLGIAAALLCGAVVGAVIFRRRRRAMRNTYSDAGGMVSLELDAVSQRTGNLLRSADAGDD